MLLKDILEFKNGKGLSYDNYGGLYPIFGSTGIIGCTNNILQNNDSIIIGRVGANCGTIQYGKGPCWITDNCIIASNINCILKYAYYLLQTMNINQFHIGSAQPLLTSEILRTLKINVIHKISEQQHIVNILGSIDDKIENNEKKAQNLEGLLIKNYKLFSNNLSDATQTIMDNCFDISIGRTPPRKEFEWFNSQRSSSNIKWISIADMANINTYIFNTSECLTKEAVNKFNIPIIPINTVILSFKLTVGRIAITSEEMISNEAIAQFKTNNEEIIPYLYSYLKCFDYNKLGSTSSIATATNSKSIKNMKFIIPNEKDLNFFYKNNQPILNKIINIQKEIIILNNLKQLYLKKFFN